MARRRESLIDRLLALPWWVTILIGVLGCAALVIIGPSLWTDPKPARATEITRSIGLIWLFACVLGAGANVTRSFFARRKFRRQSDFFDIRSLPGQQFEMILKEAFRRRGYALVENLGNETKIGSDLVLRKEGATFLVQYRQWRTTTVGVQPLRQFLGAIKAYGASGGIFVNSGTYVPEAQVFASQSGIELIDGRSLAHMAKEAQEPQPFAEPTNWGNRSNTSFGNAEASPQCPTCGKVMVLRAARRGAKAGSQFWGCSGFPECGGTRQI